MVWLAKNKFRNQEVMFSAKPRRCSDHFEVNYQNYECEIELPNGTIKRLLGYSLTWEDGPVELTSQITDLW